MLPARKSVRKRVAERIYIRVQFTHGMCDPVFTLFFHDTVAVGKRIAGTAEQFPQVIQPAA